MRIKSFAVKIELVIVKDFIGEASELAKPCVHECLRSIRKVFVSAKGGDEGLVVMEEAFEAPGTSLSALGGAKEVTVPAAFGEQSCVF